MEVHIFHYIMKVSFATLSKLFFKKPSTLGSFSWNIFEGYF